MATETLRPNGELSDSGLVANSETDHDEDPDSVSVTIAATGNNTNTEWGGDFQTPTGNPKIRHQKNRNPYLHRHQRQIPNQNRSATIRHWKRYKSLNNG